MIVSTMMLNRLKTIGLGKHKFTRTKNPCLTWRLETAAASKFSRFLFLLFEGSRVPSFAWKWAIEYKNNSAHCIVNCTQLEIVRKVILSFSASLPFFCFLSLGDLKNSNTLTKVVF